MEKSVIPDLDAKIEALYYFHEVPSNYVALSLIFIEKLYQIRHKYLTPKIIENIEVDNEDNRSLYYKFYMASLTMPQFYHWYRSYSKLSNSVVTHIKRILSSVIEAEKWPDDWMESSIKLKQKYLIYQHSSLVILLDQYEKDLFKDSRLHLKGIYSDPTHLQLRLFAENEIPCKGPRDKTLINFWHQFVGCDDISALLLLQQIRDGDIELQTIKSLFDKCTLPDEVKSGLDTMKSLFERYIETGKMLFLGE